MPNRLLTQLRRIVLRHRRLLAAGLAGVAALAALNSIAGPPPPTVDVLTAARDIPSGTVLAADDLELTAFPPDVAPTGSIDTDLALGRTTAGPIRAGEPVTDVRLVQPSLLDGYAGAVAVPVRLGDPGVARLLRVGDRIDLVATADTGAEVVARDVPVIAIPRQTGQSSSQQPGALIVVATAPDTAVLVSRSSVSAFMSALIPH